jgi:RNA polymerase sigma-70 factor (ECF subfamily)
MGLLALMLLQDSRRDARLDAAGELVLLEDQDRTVWDGEEIREGRVLVERAFRYGAPGPYRLQAGIAAEHARAARARDTDWRRIASLYGALAQVMPSPVVELNRAVAVAMAGDVERGLALMDDLASSGRLRGYRLLHSSRADLLRRLGRGTEATQAYRRALDLASNPVERAFLRRRLAEVSDLGETDPLPN